MLLKRISGKLPPHLAVHIPTLEAAGLTTTENILFTSQTVLKARLPSLLPGHIEDLTAHCLAHTGPQVINGDHELEYQEKMLSGASWEGWGISNLDDLVKGWDGIGIVEIAGGKRVAKSLLALHGVLRKLVEDRNAICRWIDTDGGFSASRAKSILDAWGVDEPEVVLERLVVSTCFQIEPDLFDLISVMQSEAQGIESSMGSLRMIVVDSITNLFKDTLMSTTSQGHAAMITVMEELAEMTYAHGLTTWVINGVASTLPSNPSSVFSATTTKPALGTSFTFTTDICLLLQETGRVFGLVDEQERERSRKQAGLRAVVEVLKSRVSPSGIWTVFETDGIQLFDVVAPPLETERNRLLSMGIAVGPARPTFGPLKDTVLP